MVRSTLLQFSVQAGPSGKISGFDEICDFGDKESQRDLKILRIERFCSSEVVYFDQSLI